MHFERFRYDVANIGPRLVLARHHILRLRHREQAGFKSLQAVLPSMRLSAFALPSPARWQRILHPVVQLLYQQLPLGLGFFVFGDVLADADQPDDQTVFRAQRALRGKVDFCAVAPESVSSTLSDRPLP